MKDISEISMKEMIEKIIMNWLNKEFNNEDALPKLVIDSLVEEIYSNRFRIHQEVKEEYILEDIEMVAQGEGIELTQEEASTLLHRFNKVEDSSIETITILMDDIVRERSEK